MHKDNLMQMSLIRKELVAHSYSTINTTGIDAKHESIFGIGLFCISLISEVLEKNISNSITGRLVLRTIAESYINLKWLTIKNDSKIWNLFRKYGCGQAKLQSVKLSESSSSVAYVTQATLDEIANEDQWDKYLTIDLGSWSGTDLRRMSNEAGVKEIYDQYYNWGSSYTHGNWGAIRESNYQNCINPLHRFHQIPLEKPKKLHSILPDTYRLINLILEIISDQYPTFPQRI